MTGRRNGLYTPATTGGWVPELVPPAPMDRTVTWPRAVLFVAGCAAGGFFGTIGLLLVISDQIARQAQRAIAEAFDND